MRPNLHQMRQLLLIPLLTVCAATRVAAQARNPDKGAASLIAEALNNLEKIKSLRFHVKTTLRRQQAAVLSVESEGQWRNGTGLQITESVWMGDRTVSTTTIVVDGVTYVKSDMDEKWSFQKSDPEDLTPHILADLPLYLKSADGFRKTGDTLFKDTACWSFEYTPVIPPNLGIRATRSGARLLITKRHRYLVDVSLTVEGQNESGETIAFVYSATFSDFNAPREIRRPSMSK